MNRSFHVLQNRAEWTRGALTPAQGGRPGRAQPRLTPAQKALVLVPRRRRRHLCPWNSNFKCQTLIPSRKSILYTRVVWHSNCNTSFFRRIVRIPLSKSLFLCYTLIENLTYEDTSKFSRDQSHINFHMHLIPRYFWAVYRYTLPLYYIILHMFSTNLLYS